MSKLLCVTYSMDTLNALTHHGQNKALERLAVEEDIEKVHRPSPALVIHVQILQRAQLVSDAMQSKKKKKKIDGETRADQHGRGLTRIVGMLRLPNRRGGALGLLEADEPPAQQLHPLLPSVGERRLLQPLGRQLQALVVPIPLRSRHND